jgi:hypothetical protein
LYARDDAVASRLADEILGVLDRIRGPWTMRLSGLPLGDPTLRHLAAGLPTAHIANSRSRRLVDGLDSVGGVRRSREPAQLERWLPGLLTRVPAPDRAFVRTNARLHAAIGALELAVVPGGGGLSAVLLTLLDGSAEPTGPGRWPWWGVSDVGGLGRELGSPVVTLTASAGLRVLGRR